MTGKMTEMSMRVQFPLCSHKMEYPCLRTSRVGRSRSILFRRMRMGVRTKPVSTTIALALIALLASSSTPAFAKVIHRHPVAPKPHQDVQPVPLSAIHVLGDRPAPFALDARAAYMIDADTGA